MGDALQAVKANVVFIEPRVNLAQLFVEPHNTCVKLAYFSMKLAYFLLEGFRQSIDALKDGFNRRFGVQIVCAHRHLHFAVPSLASSSLAEAILGSRYAKLKAIAEPAGCLTQPFPAC